MDFEHEFLGKFDEPDFFEDSYDPALKKMQERIREELTGETSIITIEMEQWLMEAAERSLKRIGWTLEEGIILFLKWTVLYPERTDIWLQHLALDCMRRVQKPYRDEDKIPLSRLETDFESALENVQQDGIKVIVDSEGKEKAMIMAWWVDRALMQVLDPEHAAERIAEIEKACAEYKEE